MMQMKKDVYKITQWKDGCVYRTKYITSVWLDVKPRTFEEEKKIAEENGGDQLVNTLESRFI